MAEKLCTHCANCLLRDYGYSNWTVEGTEVICLKRVHPDGEFDRWYGEEVRLTYAEQCPEFVEGDPQYLDVDGEEYKGLSDAAKEYLANY